jgi:hypothetical protein
MKARISMVFLDRSCPDPDLAFGQRRSEMPKKKTAKRKVRCPAKTATGKQCKNHAAGKSKYCRSHR